MFDEMCFMAKNLYNAALYKVRQAYFEYEATMSYESLDRVLKREGSADYAAMPMASSAQGTLRLVMQNWGAFWAALEEYREEPGKFTGRPKMPGYLPKTDGRSVVYLTNQNAKIRNGVMRFPKSFGGFTLPVALGGGEVQQVRVVPKNRHYVVEVVYKRPDVPMLSDNRRYMGVDLGIDNFAAVASNDGAQPVLINGKGLKSLNKHWNKRVSHLREVETSMNGVWVATSTGRAKVSNQTKQQAELTNNRNNQVKDFCHKASKKIIDMAIGRGCNTIVVGKNDGWKQESKMSKVANQTFVQIPYAVFIGMLEYKCKKHGLRFAVTDESHTSKTSWLDGETPQHHEKYAGKRVKRGLFKSMSDELINADVNGALQIIRKVFPKAKTDGVWAYGQPARVNII